MKKILKALILLVATIVVAIYIFDLGYLVNGIRNTYLRGFSGPNIYDLSYFSSIQLKTATNNETFSQSQKSTSLNLENDTLHQQLGTVYFMVNKGNEILFEFDNQKDLSNSFSMAKSMVSLCAAKAIEDGYIESWESPVSKHLPDLDASLGEQGIGAFLSMSSGLDWIESGKNPFSDNAKAYYGKDLNSLVSSKTAIDSEIGQFLYKSGNTQIAAMTIEEATGKSLADYFNESFWSKLANNNASWGTDPKGNEKAYCCLYARGRDFAKVGKMLLDSGRIEQDTVLRFSSIEKMIKPYVKKKTDGSVNDCYGIGFWLLQYKNLEIYYARGILGQYIIVIPEENLVITRLGHKRLGKDEKLHPKDLYYYIDQALELIK